MTSIAIVVGIVVVALAGVGYLVSLRKNVDTVSTLAGEKKFGDDDVGRRVHACLAAMGSQPAEDGDVATRAVEDLRKDPTAVMAEIARVYDAASIQDYDLRWTLMDLASVVGGNEALPLLDRVVRSQVPPESGDRHRFPSITRELMIRIRALEGVRAQAATGSDDARRHLLDYLESSHFSIRKSAALGLLGLPDGTQHRARVEERLPQHEHFVFGLREARVEDAGVIPSSQSVGRAPALRSPIPAPDLPGPKTPPPKREARPKGPPTI